MPLGELAQAYVAASRVPGSVHAVATEDLQGLRMRKVRGDGKCFWYALVIARSILAGGTRQDVDDLDADGVFERAARRIRLKVCNELWDPETSGLKQQYRPFFAPGEEGTEEALSEREYVEGLWTGQVFAGALELHVASLLADCVIAVLNMTPAGASLSVYSPGGDPRSPIVLVRRNMHYDVLLLPKTWETCVADAME